MARKTFAQFLQEWGVLTDHPEYSGYIHSVTASGIPETLPSRRKVLEQIVQEAEKAERLVYEDPYMKNYLEASGFRDNTQSVSLRVIDRECLIVPVTDQV